MIYENDGKKLTIDWLELCEMAENEWKKSSDDMAITSLKVIITAPAAPIEIKMKTTCTKEIGA